MGKIYFRETQKINFWWIWMLLAILAALWLWGVTQQLFLGKPWGNHPVSNIVLVFIGFIPVAILLLIIQSRLITEVRSDGLYYKFYPFHLKFKKIHYDTIERFEPITFKAIREFGGWGIRYNYKGQKALITHGNKGIEFTFLSKKKLVIGTDKPDSFMDAMKKAIHAKNQ